MEKVRNIEFVQVCWVLGKKNKVFNIVLNKMCHFDSAVLENKTYLKYYYVFSGEGLVGQQIFVTLGLDVQLLNSLSGNKHVWSVIK